MVKVRDVIPSDKLRLYFSYHLKCDFSVSYVHIVGLKNGRELAFKSFGLMFSLRFLPSDAFDSQFGAVILRLTEGLDVSHIQGQGIPKG